MPRLPLCFAVAAGCVGTVGGEGAPVSPGPGPAPPDLPGAAQASAPPPSGGAPPGSAALPAPSPALAPGPYPLRRLSAREWDSSVAALLGTGAVPPLALPRDAPNESGFEAPDTVSAIHADLFLEGAERAAATAARRSAPLLGCDPSGGAEAACVAAFLHRFGRRAYRRPLAAEEHADLAALYRGLRDEVGHDVAGALGGVVAAMLQSSGFLYVSREIAAPPARDGALVALTPHQVAARLAYLLWQAPPDEVLSAAADAGRLASPADVAAQARRLLQDGRARPALADFFGQLFHLRPRDGLVKDARIFPELGPWLEGAAADELHAFLGHLFGQARGSVRTLLGAPFTFASDRLARIYGRNAAGAAPARLDLDPAERAGLLTQIAFLAVNATPDEPSPIKRGLAVFQGLLCGVLPPPPDDVPEPPTPAPDLSTRDRFVKHAESGCASCHRLVDPLGFAFEHYDALGRFRAVDGRKPVDASGELALPGGRVMKFRGAVDLLRALADAPEARACLLRQFGRFALLRRESDGETEAWRRAAAGSPTADLDLADLFAGLLASRSFLYRLPAPGEALP